MSNRCVRDYLALLFSHGSFSMESNRFRILAGVMTTTKLENEVSELEKVATAKDSIYHTKQHARHYKQTKSNELLDCDGQSSQVTHCK